MIFPGTATKIYVRALGLLLLAILASGAGYAYYVHTSYKISSEDTKKEYALQLTRISNIILSGDSKAGFIELKQLYDKERWFRPYCHAFALSMADQVYAKQKDPSRLELGPESVICNYGFYQEYPRQILLATSDPTAANSFCIDTGKRIGAYIPDAEAECFRGIGRGLSFINTDLNHDEVKMAAYAVAACKKDAPNKADLKDCIAGVFNSLDRAATDGSYGLSVNRRDPQWICKLQDPSIRSNCIGNYKLGALSQITETDLKDLAAELERTYKKNADMDLIRATYLSRGYEMGRLNAGRVDRYQTDIALCASAPSLYQADCIQGYSVGLAKHSRPLAQYVGIIAFCKKARAAMPSLEVGDCPSDTAVSYLKGMYEPAQRELLCSELQKGLGRSCDINPTQ